MSGKYKHHKIARTKTFLKEFIILFGFLNGLWVAVNFDPSAVIFKSVKVVIDTLYPTNGLAVFFVLLPTILLIGTLIGIYYKGGVVGLLAVGLGFFAGTLIFTLPTISIGLLIGAFVIGYFAVRR
jgi:hypothetical protein